MRDAQWKPLRAAACDDLVRPLAGLAAADPPLDLASYPVTRQLLEEPSPLDSRAHKHREDLVDAALCAWTAALWARHGLDRCQVLGESADHPGAATIIAPARPMQRRLISPRAPAVGDRLCAMTSSDPRGTDAEVTTRIRAMRRSREMRRRKTSARKNARAWVLLMLLGALIAIGPIYQAATHQTGASSTKYTVIGAALFALGLAGMALQMIETKRLVFAPAPRVSELEGSRATELRRDRAGSAAGCLMLAALAVLIAAAAWNSLQVGRTWDAALRLLVAALAAFAAVRSAFGPAPGVWLGPESITDRSRGRRASIRWEQVTALNVDTEVEWLTIEPQSEWRVERSKKAAPWRRGPSSVRPYWVGCVEATGLPLDAFALARVVDHYLRHPELRAELGTPTSLATIAELTRTSPLMTVGERAALSFDYSPR